ncbi:hypothetical protein AB0G87_00210 [Streptomyces asoensis]|uniref:hypothetical protein n=1 Tax=Streptomyces asoensis TaxID=249586 RepID=UPI0033D77F6B
MSSAPPLLLTQVCHALQQAGFHLVGDGVDDGRPGISVTQVPAGVLVRWTASQGFRSLAIKQPGTSGDSMQAIVRAAVSGLLSQLGHTVTDASDTGDLLIRADQ